MGITLWHVPISHSRRAVLGGLHPVVCAIVTRGRHHTVPALSIDGEGIGDSSAIIAELERRFPERPLYPADPQQRRRALELEELFDSGAKTLAVRSVAHGVWSWRTGASSSAGTP